MKTKALKYIYITGTSFSGSTLLAFLMNSHPRMVSISELGPFNPTQDLRQYRCSCGAFFLRCPFFLKLKEKMIAVGHDFDLEDWQLHYQLSQTRLFDIFLTRPLRSTFLETTRDHLVGRCSFYRRAIEHTNQRVVDFGTAVLDTTGSQYFVDATKDSTRIKFLSQSPQIDLWVIHLIRDVRGAAASYIKNTSRDAASSARRWRIDNMNSERARRFVNRDRWFRLLYDDLCREPEQVFDRIADFVGCERAPVPENFYRTTHHILGNRMRMQSDGDGAIRVDTSWADRLNEKQLAVIAGIAGKTNRLFGHPWP